MPDWQIAVIAWEALLLTIGLAQDLVGPRPIVTPATNPASECRQLDTETLQLRACDDATAPPIVRP